jgi:hypothetical protein
MKMKRKPLLLFLLLVLPGMHVPAGGQQREGMGASRPPAVTLAPIDPITVAPGKTASLILDFRVAPGYHINSSRPKNSLLLATALHLDPATNIMVGKITYPAGQDLTFDFAPDEALNVYTGDFRITAKVTPASTAPKGVFSIHGSLKYQACDDRRCYPPKEVPVDFDVRVQSPKAASSAHNPAQSPHVHQ